MSQDVAVTPEVEQVDDGILLQKALELGADKFAALKVADRDAILYLMLRDNYATMAYLVSKIDEYEAKAREMTTPEGLQEIMNKFMSGGLGGGMLGMLR